MARHARSSRQLFASKQCRSCAATPCCADRDTVHRPERRDPDLVRPVNSFRGERPSPGFRAAPDPEAWKRKPSSSQPVVKRAPRFSLNQSLKASPSLTLNKTNAADANSFARVIHSCLASAAFIFGCPLARPFLENELQRKLNFARIPHRPENLPHARRQRIAAGRSLGAGDAGIGGLW